MSKMTVTLPETAQDTDARLEKLYHVIILNDEEHTFDYVIEMLQSVFGLAMDVAMTRTLEADQTGSSIVHTCPLEEAENKRDRVHAYGPDWRMPNSRGPVSALVEPAAG
jgi:ATP-dependent Clp protease adaptor protein ClpS